MKIPPPAVSIFYRLGIVAVGFMMVLLPVVYLILVAGVGYLLYLHAFHWGPGLLNELSGARGRNQLTGFVLMYFGPLIAGGILLLLMMKPLLARRPARPARRLLDPQQEPFLFDFVGCICDALGSPRPKEIVLDSAVNASAGFRRGWLSLIGGDLVLTIGMPLIAGMTARQFAGVLAHEFGHFAQGTGMRVTFIVRSINAWFARVVYEEDSWDEKLLKWGEQISIRETIVIIWTTRGFIWLTKRILWVLMQAGHAISCFMLRQMEFDADRCEARLAGSETFAETADRLQVLNVAWQGALADVRGSWTEKQLADDLCGLMLANIDQLTPEILQQIRSSSAEHKTKWHDTHPADTDRVASAARENAQGIFRIAGPASHLFRHYARLVEDCTQDFYRTALGEQFTVESLVPVAQVVARQAADRQGNDALSRYYHGAFNRLRPLAIDTPGQCASADLSVASEKLAALRTAVNLGAADFQRTVTEYFRVDECGTLVDQAAILIEAGFKVQPKDFLIESSDMSSVQVAQERYRRQRVFLEPDLQAFENKVQERMVTALGLLPAPEVAEQLPDATAWSDDAARLCEVSRALAAVWPKLLDLRDTHIGLTVLFNNLADRQANETQMDTINKYAAHNYGQLVEISRALDVSYPFPHAEKGVTVARYAVAGEVAANDFGAIYSGCAHLLEQLNLLSARVASRLAVIAESVESIVTPPVVAEAHQSPAAPVAEVVVEDVAAKEQAS